MHPYEAWLKMGHVDSNAGDCCKKCEITFEEFSEKFISCDDERENRSIAQKKLIDVNTPQYPSQHRYPPYGAYD